MMMLQTFLRHLKGNNMEEVRLKTHLIVTDVHEEYFVDWCGKLYDSKPELKDGLPVFIIVGTEGRIELNTIDIPLIEKCAKRMTRPKGKQAFTSDTSRIYLLEEDGNQKLMAVVTHNHIKKFAPMYDPFMRV